MIYSKLKHCKCKDAQLHSQIFINEYWYLHVKVGNFSHNILLQPIAVLKERQVRSSSPHPAILRKVLTVQPLDPLVGEYGDVIGQGARVAPAAQLGVGEGS